MGNARPAAQARRVARWAGPIDIAIKDGRIVEMAPGLEAEAAEVIDASGRLVSPPFVDPHFHMDATLSLGQPRLNVSGTLLEGIALWGELKPLLTVEAVVERALRYCDLAVAQGLLAIRSAMWTSRPRRWWGRGASWRSGNASPPISTCNSWPSRRTGSTAPRARRRT
jgi:cytosine/adenosine deaminase-related metal-dependent hydrolase